MQRFNMSLTEKVYVAVIGMCFARHRLLLHQVVPNTLQNILLDIAEQNLHEWAAYLFLSPTFFLNSQNKQVTPIMTGHTKFLDLDLTEAQRALYR